jgi:hypothetical protein
VSDLVRNLRARARPPPVNRGAAQRTERSSAPAA